MTSKSTWQERLQIEYHDVADRLGKLTVFLGEVNPDRIDREDLWLLIVQKSVMAAYFEILNKRLSRLKSVG